jgi:hypothetical protein
LPEVRGQIILLVWIRHESIVGCHHGNVQMDEIFQERRSVILSFARRNYRLLAESP